jgi:hypothetical protein
MMGAILTLLVIGVSACAGTHRNRFVKRRGPRERPTVGVASGEGTTQTEANEHAND